MPAAGGLPTRRTFEGNANVVGWTPDGKILYATRRYSTLPDTQLATIDSDNRVELVPLSQAAQGSYDATGPTSSSPACRSRAATRNDTRAAPRRISGSTRPATKRRR